MNSTESSPSDFQSVISLFFSFRGRTNRLPFWLGTLALNFIAFLINYNSQDAADEHKKLLLILPFIMHLEIDSGLIR